MNDNLAEPLPRLPMEEVEAARAAYLAALQRFHPTLQAAGQALLDRLDRPNWSLEWSLPYWLGQAFGLEREVTRKLTLANVFGLAYVRLQDDAIDGELADKERSTASLLGTALYHLWITAYHTLFDARSPFWVCFDRSLAAWVRGTLRDEEPEMSAEPPVAAEGRSGVTREQALELAERGAPLKVGAVGACLLAQRDEEVPALEAAIDSLLGAAVLIDHAQDWGEDLAAGRANAFVTYAVRRSEPGAGGSNVWRAVLEEMYVRDAGRPYFALVHELIRQTREEARRLGCLGLEEYTTRLDENVLAYGARLARQAETRLRQAVADFLAA